MTLVLSCISHDYIVQVSDRQVTWSDGRRGPEDRNKVVVFGITAAFSYTGLAEVGRDRTDKWLAHVLSTSGASNPVDAAQDIKREATKVFQNIRLSRKLKRHAFVCAGWCWPAGSPDLRPFLSIVSNAMDEKLQYLSEAKKEFPVYWKMWKQRDGPAVIPIGQWTQTPEINNLIRQTRRASQRGAPHMMRDSLSKAIRAVSNVEKTVGKDLLAVIMPKGHIAPSSSAHLVSTVGIAQAEFFHLPHNDPTRSYPYGAIHVVGDQVLEQLFP